MSVEAEVYPRTPVRVGEIPVDPEWRAIAREIEALDSYLKVQNLRRMEEECLIRLLSRGDER